MWKRLWLQLQSGHLWALLVKEIRQTIRNRHLLYLLLFPPTVQLLILGASLDPELHQLKLAVCDQANTSLSRHFQDLLTGTGVFQLAARCKNTAEVTKLLDRGEISAAVIIPSDFDEQLIKDKHAHVQTLLDGADAYSANVAKGYLQTTISRFKPWSPPSDPDWLIKPVSTMLFNPGLKASWYFVPGIMGAVITLVGTLVASAVLLREKELGTLEQLLMTPALAWEIVAAKVFPLVCLLIADLAAGILLSMLFFGMPFRGNVLVFLLGSVMYVCVSIGFGLFLGTLCKSQRQAQLSSFFINIPVIQLSGSVVPFESMPPFMQTLSTFDPLKYFSIFARASILKGAGLDILWPELLIITVCAIIILTASTMRFRQQLV